MSKDQDCPTCGRPSGWPECLSCTSDDDFNEARLNDPLVQNCLRAGMNHQQIIVQMYRRHERMMEELVKANQPVRYVIERPDNNHEQNSNHP